MTTPAGQAKLLPLEFVRWRLAMVWFPTGGLIFLLLIGQSIGGVYGAELQTVWGWALPNFLPTLALMVSVFTAEALRPYRENSALVRRNFYLLALSLSIFYLLAFLLSILVQPILQLLNAKEEGGVEARIELLQISNIWLGPLQGLVIAALGALFFLKEEEKKAKK
jgi:hypothetical protein